MGNLHIHVGFLLAAILALYLQATATATDAPSGMTQSPTIPPSQNPTSQSQEPAEPSTALITTISQQATTSATPTSASQPTSATETSSFRSTSPGEMSASPPSPSTLAPEALTTFSATTVTNQESVTLGEDRTTVNKAEICEENSKRVMLICFIIIGALVFVCVLLLLVIVVLATKMSHLKRRQPSKRLPRSNGDFLSGNSLWPVGLETLQRIPNETAGTEPKVQGLGLERTSAGQEPFEEAGKKLAREISTRQKQREASIKPQDGTITMVAI